MAKDAPKKKASSASGDKARILEYLQTTNRPYSAIDVFNNLRQEIAKTAVVKILTALGESGEITAKQYGKQFVYVARQDILECPSIEELEELDTQINELKESNIALQASVKQQQAVLTGLTSALTDGQIQERLAVLQVECSKMDERLVALRQGAANVDEAQRKRIEADYEKFRKAWRVRKKMCLEIVNTICEAAEQKPKAFMEQVGLEDDETVGELFDQTDYPAFMDTA